MTSPISIEQYNTEIDEAMKRMDAGEFYTHEEVAQIAANLLNCEHETHRCHKKR